MIGKEIILGLVSIAMGGGLLYYAKAKHIPDFVKMFVVSGWIGTVLGYCGLVSGAVHLVAGIVGWDIWPMR